jgi:hypothetical protein
MKEWTDTDLQTLIGDAMSGREGDVAPGRARELARAAIPARRHWHGVAAASVGVILVCGAVVYVVARGSDQSIQPVSGPATSTGGPTTNGTEPGTTRENYQRAVAASEAAVASVPVPDGSQRLAGKPSGWPADENILGPADGSLTRTAWWSTPLSVDEVAAFLADHTPPGTRLPSGDNPVVSPILDGAGYAEYNTVVSADPAAYSAPRILVQFAAIGDHSALRIDTFLAARYAVPDDDRVAADVTSVEIVRVTAPKEFGGVGDGGPLPPVVLTAADDPAAVDRLVSAFNGLYGSEVDAFGWMSCPMIPAPEPRWTVTFVSTREDGSVDTTVATVAPMCWGQVQVMVNGDRSPVTLDPSGWVETLDDVVTGRG